jgi:hypothetical protein
MSGNELESDINIRNRARVPKSFKVEEDINMNFGGTNTKYNVPLTKIDLCLILVLVILER